MNEHVKMPGHLSAAMTASTLLLLVIALDIIDGSRDLLPFRHSGSSADQQSTFQYIRALLRPVKFFQSKLGKQFLYRASFVYEDLSR